ncbi:MAG: alpha/beta hydrolase [Alphaproteobacteria bacterium]|nr:alpha/beta hydrolase [Alphaproteobacteria bacterium]
MSARHIEQIYVDELGERSSDQPSLVLIHGLGATGASWRPLIESMQAAAAPISHCVMIDLPGAGLSPQRLAIPTLSGLAQDVVSVIKALGLNHIHLVGHSMGSLLAQKIAELATKSEFPAQIKSVSLLAAIAHPSDAMRQRLMQRAETVRQHGMAAIAEQIAENGASLSSRQANPLLAAYLRSLHLAQEPSGYAGQCEVLASASGVDLMGLPSPFLLLAGDEDAVAPPSAVQAMEDKLPQAEMVVLHRCGHWLPLERPGECGKYMAEFLQHLRR